MEDEAEGVQEVAGMGDTRRTRLSESTNSQAKAAAQGRHELHSALVYTMALRLVFMGLLSVGKSDSCDELGAPPLLLCCLASLYVMLFVLS